MKKIRIIICLLLCLPAASQNLTVKFKIIRNLTFDLASEQKNFTLVQNHNSSIFYLNDIKDKTNFKHADKLTPLAQRDTIGYFNLNDQGIVYLHKTAMFKNFIKNTITYNTLLTYRQGIILKDSINVFDWKITESKDTIIGGFNCKKATTTFRGANYTAHYSSEIANRGGPWKFDGLPGFIIHVRMKSEYATMEIYPTEIIKENKSIAIENPYREKNAVLFCEAYKHCLKQEALDFKFAKSKNKFLTKRAGGTCQLAEWESIAELKETRVYE